MPARVTRHAMNFIDEHANTIIFLMFVVMLLTAIFASIGWNQARNAQQRVNVIELDRAAERKAADIQRVSTCFTTARNRPRVIQILEGLAASLDDRVTRSALDDQIEAYDESTPTRTGCLALAAELGIDPKPFDRPAHR